MLLECEMTIKRDIPFLELNELMFAPMTSLVAKVCRALRVLQLIMLMKQRTKTTITTRKSKMEIKKEKMYLNH